MAKKRRNILNEILKTEESYVKSLESLEGVIAKLVTTIIPLNTSFLKDLRICAGEGEFYCAPLPVLRKDDKKADILGIFRRSHRSSEKQDNRNSKREDIKIEEVTKKLSITVGETMKKFTPFLRLYNTYINGFDDAVLEVRKLRAENPALDKVLKETRKQHGEELNSYLIKPIQRVPRYKMLVEELIKATPPGHFDLDRLRLALEEVSKVATHLNEQKKERDSQRILSSILRRFDNASITHEDPDKRLKVSKSIIQPWRHIVKDGHLKLFRDNRWVLCDAYLLTDLFLITNCEGGDCSPSTELEQFMEKTEKSKKLMHLSLLTMNRKEDTPQEFSLTLVPSGETLLLQGIELGEAEEWWNEVIKCRNEEISKLGELGKNLESLDGLVLKKRRLQLEMSKHIADFTKLKETREEKLKRLEPLRKKDEESRIQLVQLNKLRGEIDKDDKIIRECNARLKKGSSKLTQEKEDMEQIDLIILGLLRGDQTACDDYFGDPIQIEKLGIQDFISLSEDQIVAPPQSTNFLSVDEAKAYYESDLSKLRDDLAEAKYTLDNIQKKYAEEAKQVGQEVPKDKNGTVTGSSLRLKVLEEENGKLVRENKDLHILLSNKTNSHQAVSRENLKLKKELETAKSATEEDPVAKARKEADKIMHDAKLEAEKILKKALDEAKLEGTFFSPSPRVVKAEPVKEPVKDIKVPLPEIKKPLPKEPIVEQRPILKPVEKNPDIKDPVVEKVVLRPVDTKVATGSPRTDKKSPRVEKTTPRAETKQPTNKTTSTKDPVKVAPIKDSHSSPPVDQSTLGLSAVKTNSFSSKKEIYEQIAKNNQPPVIDLKTLKEKKLAEKLTK